MIHLFSAQYLGQHCIQIDSEQLYVKGKKIIALFKKLFAALIIKGTDEDTHSLVVKVDREL